MTEGWSSPPEETSPTQFDCPLTPEPGMHLVDFDEDKDHWFCDTCGDGGDRARYTELTVAQLGDLPPDDEPLAVDLPDGCRYLSDILSDPEVLQPPRPVVPCLSWAGRVTLLAAREKLGKSTLASAAAAAVTRGTEFLDGPARAGLVLWLGLEEHISDLGARLRRFGVDDHRLIVLEPVRKPLEALEQASESVRPTLIVVDSLAAMVSGRIDEPSSSTAWTPIMVRLARIARDTGAAILLIHHARKSDGSYRDSTAIGAGVDVVIEMKADSTETNQRHLKGKGRFAVVATTVYLDESGYHRLGPERSLEERILDHVAANPGCTKGHVRDGVAGRGTAVLREVDAMLGAGHLENRGTPQRFELHVPGSAGNGPGTEAPGRPVPSKEPGEPRRDQPGTDSGTGRGSQSQTLRVETGNRSGRRVDMDL